MNDWFCTCDDYPDEPCVSCEVQADYDFAVNRWFDEMKIEGASSVRL